MGLTLRLAMMGDVTLSPPHSNSIDGRVTDCSSKVAMLRTPQHSTCGRRRGRSRRGRVETREMEAEEEVE